MTLFLILWKRADWALILVFIFFYRMSDSYMAPMAFPFYVDMGFSKGEIAFVSKVFGMAATIFGGLVGGLIMSRMSMLKGLMLCGILQGITNLMFVVQAYVGHSVPMLMLTLSLDNIAGGMASTAFGRLPLLALQHSLYRHPIRAAFFADEPGTRCLCGQQRLC